MVGFILTLWQTFTQLWKINMFNGQIHCKCPFSIANCGCLPECIIHDSSVVDPYRIIQECSSVTWKSPNGPLDIGNTMQESYLLSGSYQIRLMSVYTYYIYISIYTYYIYIYEYTTYDYDMYIYIYTMYTYVTHTMCIYIYI